MTRRDALAEVKRERERVDAARKSLEARAQGVHPLVLVGGGLLAGLIAGRLFGRVRLPRSAAAETLVVGALQRPLAGLLEGLVATLLGPASVDPKSTNPSGTQSPEP